MAGRYAYQAKNRLGQLESGTLEADNEMGVARYLRERGFVATSITLTELRNADISDSWLIRHQKVSLRDLSVFCRQLATLVSAGVSIVQAISVLVEQTEKQRLKNALREVLGEVQTGETFSGALKQHPKIFPVVMISMIEAGELGGIMDQVLLGLADQFEKEYKLNGKVRTALTYPAIVVCMAILSVTFILTFVMPMVIGMFEGMKTELPWPTRMLLFLSNALRNHGPEIVVILGLMTVAGLWLRQKPVVRHWLDQLTLKLPVFGMLARKVAIARFSRTFSGLIRSGVPMIAALDVVKSTVDNLVMADSLQAAQESVTRGTGLAVPFRQNPLFPPMVVHMVAVGEETGELETMLLKAADFFEGEVDDMVNRLSSLIDPVLIVGIGVIIGFIVVSVMLPLFDIVTNFNRAV